MTCYLLALLLGATGNLVPNGDLEAVSPPDAPPPGWTMWGAQQWKDPANYGRDTTHAAAGVASLRMHQPAGTGGYLVTSPEQAMVPLHNYRYRLSFQIRADAPGSVIVGLQGYRTLAPYVDAPSAGSWSIEVGPEWREYSYEVVEGQDFFSDETAYLLLYIRPQASAETAQTLWLDEMVFRGSPEPGAEARRLVDPATFELPPLDHGLQPGTTLAISADPRVAAGPTVQAAGGISFHRLAGYTGVPYDREGQMALDPRLVDAVRELRLPMTRFYGVGDEPFDVEGAVDRAYEFAQLTGLPTERVILELEDQGARRRIAPEVWARAAARSVARGYGFRRWEVGNEVYSAMWSGAYGGAYATPEDYVAQVQAVAAAVRAVQPEALIGLSVHHDNLPWGNRTLRLAAGSYDFICPHLYVFPRVDRADGVELAIERNQQAIDRARRFVQLVRYYNPDREVVIDDTEWGLHGGDGTGARADELQPNGGIWGVLHRGIRVIYYAWLDGLIGASSWEMFTRATSPGFGILTRDEPDRRFMIYWLYYYLNRSLLPERVATSGTGPWSRESEWAGPLTPLLVTREPDGSRVAVVWANASEAPQPATLTLAGPAYAAVEATTLTAAADAYPLLERREDLVGALPATLDGGTLRTELPPRSISFLWLTR